MLFLFREEVGFVDFYSIASFLDSLSFKILLCPMIQEMFLPRLNCLNHSAELSVTLDSACSLRTDEIALGGGVPSCLYYSLDRGKGIAGFETKHFSI